MTIGERCSRNKIGFFYCFSIVPLHTIVRVLVADEIKLRGPEASEENSLTGKFHFRFFFVVVRLFVDDEKFGNKKKTLSRR